MHRWLVVIFLLALIFVLLSHSAEGRTETAVLAGGCFWGMEGVFEHVKGVSKVVSGYSGGDKSTTTYEQVSSETTAHAEAIEITFDPSIISYGTLLRIYFLVAHDPTELNRQGPDVGPSYRSHIFTSSETQATTAREYIDQLTKSKTFSAPIVTRVEPLKAFYPAEEMHQNYLANHLTQPYIVINDLPKIESLKKRFPDFYVR